MGQNKELLVFPIVTFLFTLLIVLFFLVPVTLRPTGYSYISAEHWQAIYAADGLVCEPFNQEMLNAAWKFKKQ